MDSKNIIIILLFIVPGKIFQSVANLFDIPQKEKQNEFSQLINGILLSLPIIVITLCFFQSGCKFTTIDELSIAFKNTNFTIKFCISLFVNSIIGGVLFGISKDYLYIPLNHFRKKYLKRLAISHKSCLSEFLLKGNKMHYVDVIHKREVYSGFLYDCSIPTEDREIVLNIVDIGEESKNSINTISKIYIDLDRDIVIKDYDLSEYQNSSNDAIHTNNCNTNTIPL